MIKEFIKKFTEEEFLDYTKLIKVSQEYYLAEENLRELSKKTGRQPLFIGRFLGIEKFEKKLKISQTSHKSALNIDVKESYSKPSKEGKTFKPSLWLLQEIAKKSDRKVIVYKESEWKYICGKDVKVVSSQWSVAGGEDVEKYVLVVNVFGECLGYGILKDGMLKNVFDIGDFLRREKH